jgi:mono/diheme cytochrome c family protein
MPQATVKTFPADNGPNFISVSSYSTEMQEYYKIFERKCSRCHTLARPINSEFVGEAWRKYVYKMMRKPGSGLTPKTAVPIIEFLIYDSQVRKKE